MKVRHKPLFGVVLLLLGVLCLLLGLWLITLGEFSPATLPDVLPGVIVTVVGILYLVQPYFWITPTSVEVPIGPRRRTFPFRTLEFEDNKLFAIGDDGRKQVPVTRWLAHSGDWAAVVERVARR